VLIIGQQGYTGGVNGMTDLKTMLGWDTRTDSRQVHPVLRLRGAAGRSILLCRWIQTSKAGTLLLAMRDKEDRVRFSGYDVSNFKVFTFCLAAALSGIGGAMFSLQVGFMSPSFVGIVPSVEMVIFAAVGGRMSLVGAVYGTLLVNAGKTYFSESFPDLWLFLMAALFHRRDDGLPDGPGRRVGRVTWCRGGSRALREGPQAAAGDRRRPLRRLECRPEATARCPQASAASAPREPVMSNTDFALAVEDLSVSFDGFKAIDALTLYMSTANELRVIIGPNGAGKTTLLDLICGDRGKQRQHQVQEHRAHVDGRVPSACAGIGRKFQTPSIYENLSVFQNLEVSFPRGRSVFGALAFRAPTRSRAGAGGGRGHRPG
jgi:hypothetical protein